MFSKVLPVALFTAGSLAVVAPVIEGNPVGVTYKASFDGHANGIKGYVAASSNINGTGAIFNVNFEGLPASVEPCLGPFMYHIHENPVPDDGNCTATGAHLDPTGAGESPACNAADPATCQVGDLAGKYGNMTEASYQKLYLDLYVSLSAGNPAFLGNRSIVVHSNNKTRLACANFSIFPGPSSCNATHTGTWSHKPTPTPSTCSETTTTVAKTTSTPCSSSTTTSTTTTKPAPVTVTSSAGALYPSSAPATTTKPTTSPTSSAGANTPAPSPSANTTKVVGSSDASRPSFQLTSLAMVGTLVAGLMALAL